MALVNAALGWSNKGHWQDATEEVLAQIGNRRDATALLYLTDPFAPYAKAILDRIAERLAPNALSGTVGLGISAGQQVFVNEAAMALLVMDLPSEQVTSFSSRGHVPIAPASFDKALIHSDIKVAQGPMLPHNGDSAFYMGAVTASRQASVQFWDQGSIQGGVTGLFLSADMPVLSAITQGCRPIGPVREVTATDNGNILTLDGEPALEMLASDAGTQGPHWRRWAHELHVGTVLPGRDRPEFIFRNIVGLDQKRGSLAVGEHCQRGAHVVFGRRQAQTALDDMRQTLQDLAERQRTPPQAGLYFSCVSRGPHLFQRKATEQALIREILGDFPLVGLYGNGELHHDQVYLHSGVLCAFYDQATH